MGAKRTVSFDTAHVFKGQTGGTGAGQTSFAYKRPLRRHQFDHISERTAELGGKLFMDSALLASINDQWRPCWRCFGSLIVVTYVGSPRMVDGQRGCVAVSGAAYVVPEPPLKGSKVFNV